MSKQIDFKKKLAELVREYPEVIDIMKELGFEEIVKPGMLNTAGRFMTIPAGAGLRKIDMDIVKNKFRNKGFEIIE